MNAAAYHASTSEPAGLCVSELAKKHGKAERPRGLYGAEPRQTGIPSGAGQSEGRCCPQETMPGPFYSRKNRATPATVMTVPMISLRETRCLLMME